MQNITLTVSKPRAKEGTLVAPEHWKIESNHEELDGPFERRYVNITGYFGEFNPNTFAAAPDLLEALRKAVTRQGFTNDDLIQARTLIEQATKQP